MKLELDLEMLTGNQLLKVSLSLVEKLLPAINSIFQGRNQITSLQGHVKLKMGDVFAKVFPEGRIERLT
jgi:hypothetical protein